LYFSGEPEVFMNKVVLSLSVALAFVLGFALNGVIQNCKTSCARGGHASCEKSCERGGQHSQGGACCKKGVAEDCCAKTAAGDVQECCKKHEAGDKQECCAKHDAAKSAPAAAQEIKVGGQGAEQGEKACCKKGAHEKT